ncbi:MAG TPA: metallophosphoesterase family protein [Pyrinomonadaceae bacterium]|nr:metallophosphoesterase family protein [Pyrinomonadaceae bacterium]
MRTMVHLSDIHFGRVDEAIIEPLIALVAELKPDVVAVSGDLTQRARSEQFQAARAFLDRLPEPQIVVPGNHDVPLYNIFARFLQPLDKYRRFITNDLEPFYADEEIAVMGINTARSLTFKGGRVNEEQVAAMREKLCPLGDKVVKIVVTHHPFDLPEGHDDSELVGRAEMAMQTLADCGADVFLAGHLHVSHTGHTAKRYQIGDHSALVVQAGTATSTRGRGEANSFNVIRVDYPFIAVERLEWQPAESEFISRQIENFQQVSNGWTRVAEQ